MKKFTDFILRILLALLCLTILQIVFGLIFGIDEQLSAIFWVLLSNLLIVLVLSYAVFRTDAYSLKLTSALFFMFFGIYVFNTQIEAFFFQLQITRSEAVRMMLQGLMVTLLFSPAIVFLLNKMKISNTVPQPKAQNHHSRVGYIWRFILGDVFYVILYCIAGALVLPYVGDFYAEVARMPEPDKIIFMQVFRGLVYMVVTLPLIRILNTKKLKTALLIGLHLSILGGIAPLLVPNPFMPTHIRLAHGIEIAISNFIFGAIIALLFTKKLSQK